MPRTSKAGMQIDLKRSSRSRAAQNAKRAVAARGNGHAADPGESFDLQMLLDALQSVRVGDFSVRLPRDQVGLAGKVADAFNEIVAANQRMAHQLEEVGQVVGHEGKTKKRVKFGLSAGAGATWRPRSTC